MSAFSEPLVLYFAASALFVTVVLLRQFPEEMSLGVVFFLVFQGPLEHIVGGQESFAGLAVRRADEVLVAGMAIVLAERCARMGLRRFLKDRPLLLGALFVLVCLVSGLVNGVSAAHLFLGTFMLAKCWLALLFFYTTPRHRFSPADMLRWIDVLLAVLLVGTALNLALGEHWTLAIGPGRIGEYGGVPRAHSFYVHPVHLGQMTAMGIAMWVVRYARTSNRAFFVWVPLLGVAMAVTFLAKPIVALVAVMGAAFVVDTKMRVRVLGAAMLLATFAVVMWQPMMELVALKFELYVWDPQARIRGLSYFHAFQILQERPFFGAGPGQYGGFVAKLLGSGLHDQLGMTRLLERSGQATVDTYWPHLLAETGLVGGGLFIGVLAVAARKVLSVSARSSDECLQILAITSALWAVHMCVTSLVAGPFADPRSWFTPLLVLGYVCSRGRVEEPFSVVPTVGACSVVRLVPRH